MRDADSYAQRHSDVEINHSMILESVPGCHGAGNRGAVTGVPLSLQIERAIARGKARRRVKDASNALLKRPSPTHSLAGGIQELWDSRGSMVY